MNDGSGSKKGYIMKQFFGQDELHEREALCTQQEAPNCVSVCPLHINARDLCNAVKAGNFIKGREILEAGTPFFHIVAYACEAPCEAGCKLAEIGSGISLRALERASIKYSENKSGQSVRRFLIPQKNNRIAVLGADLFSLSAAAELGRKGYRVTVISEGKHLLNQLEGLYGYMEESDIELDLAIFDRFKVDRRFNESIDYDYIANLSEQYDAICISGELHNRIYPADSGKTDLFTLETGMDKLFAPPSESSVIGNLSLGKRAAISIDRFVQKASLSAGREQEGSYTTTLFTSLEGVKPSGRVHSKKDTYNEEEAVSEAARCIQCECLECVKGCAYLQHYKRYPKQAIREIYNNLSIVMGNHMANGMINSCALCGQCKAICPNDFDLGEICKRARQTMIMTDRMPPSTHEFALADMAFSNSDSCFLAKHQPNTNKSTYLFFPGCQMAACAPDTIVKTYADLTGRLSGGVGLLLGCCGAIADWSGQQSLREETSRKLIREWERLGKPTVITACPSCYKELGQTTGMTLTGIWDILEKIGLPVAADEHDSDKKIVNNSDPIPLPAKILAVHDACGARGDKSIRDSIRRLVKMMGYEIQELHFSGETAPCCGFGGMASFADKVVAQKMTSLCIGQSKAPYLTYCMNCRDRFVKTGKNARHLLELVYGDNPRISPDLSKRYYNRIVLKQTLLSEMWGEKTMENGYDFNIFIEDDVRSVMDARMILESDIMEVLKQTRLKKNVICEKQTGLFITTQRIGNVSFWLKYKTASPDVYHICSAYSHRMTVEED